MPSSRRPPFSVAIEHQAEADLVTLTGIIDEAADLSPLAGLGARPIEIDLRGVLRINSSGVRAWIDVVRALPADVPLTFVRCPPPIVDQCNMVVGFVRARSGAVARSPAEIGRAAICAGSDGDPAAAHPG